ncbi:MAG TPA: UDP-glucose/GDP-mannose dehydrogenase family protein [Nitrospirales bacterium]|nr:UDP-glucose/GDP-mannose dehydrogenase family protein [Nitrospirales bacterium]HIO22471.1 UDP-glucose/GDP-mannose dehydrogenase family protein [Nitrospirales bacterium]
MHISVIGSGYVGLVTAACFAEFGLQVTCMDQDPRRIAALESGEIPFYEPGLHDLVGKGRQAGRLTFTTNLTQAVEQALVIFIAVGTPPRDDGSVDLSAIEAVATGIGREMTSYKVIVTKSTVPVGTGRQVISWIESSLREPVRFDVVSNPEFLREGSAIEDFIRPNRVVLGAERDESVAILKDLYQPLYLIETPIVVTSLETAELIKYASNTFLATKISFINEMSVLCEQVGADVRLVAKAMGLDGRIGSKFLHAGPGYGGSCFPKDVDALVATGKEHRCEMGIAKAAVDANVRQKTRMVEKIRTALGDLTNKRIGVLGLSFKPNTSDIRESPSIAIIRLLLKEGAHIQAYDPEAMRETAQQLPELKLCSDSYEVSVDADAIVLATEWNQFRNLDLERIKTQLRTPIFIDLRNVYQPARMAKMGFQYWSIGRPSLPPA